MISRHEFNIAVNTALAALTATDPRTPPLPGNGAHHADVVCFDFWPNESLRIVGTNGRRMAVTFCRLPGLPHAGKFLVSRADAVEALRVFGPAGPPVSMQLFGFDCMLFTSGEDALMVQCAHGVSYPEYHVQLADGQLPQKGATFDTEALWWALDLAAATDVRLHITAYGPTTFRPVIPAGTYQSIYDMAIAIKPLRAA